MRKLLASFVFVTACAGASKPASDPGAAASAAANAQTASQSAEASAALAKSVASPTRTATNVARDPARHPLETLSFFGVQPTQTVVELWPGGGWYTEVLAPLLRDQGKLIAVAPTGQYLQPYKEFLASNPIYDRVQLIEVTPPAQLALGPDGSADVVLTFRNLHGWIQNGYGPAVFEAISRVLKPGGVLGIEEHRAPSGAAPEESAKNGYVSEDAAIALATGAGLVLEERSEINANPKDTKDYPNGVWSLPPTLRGGDVDKAKFVAIGESDRMTLRFKKPAPRGM